MITSIFAFFLFLSHGLELELSTCNHTEWPRKTDTQKSWHHRMVEPRPQQPLIFSLLMRWEKIRMLVSGKYSAGLPSFPFRIAECILPASRKIMSWCHSTNKPSSRIASAEECLLSRGYVPFLEKPVSGDWLMWGLKDLGVSLQHKITLKSHPFLDFPHKLCWGLIANKPQLKLPRLLLLLPPLRWGFQEPMKTSDATLRLKLSSDKH